MEQQLEALINYSAALCRLNLIAGKSFAQVSTMQHDAFTQIGFANEEANALTTLIMSKATDGFQYSAKDKEALFSEIRRRTDALLEKREG